MIIAGSSCSPAGIRLVFGVGSTLIELFGPDQVRVHPAVSSIALAAARMGWSYGTYEVLRITGDEVDCRTAPSCLRLAG